MTPHTINTTRLKKQHEKVDIGLTDLSLFVNHRHPGTEITMTRRPRAPEGRRGRPAAGTHRTAATTAANRVRGSRDAHMIRKLCDARPEEV